jgi:hypothetical protein
MTDFDSLPTAPIDVAPFRHDTVSIADEPRQKSVGAAVSAACFHCLV